MSWDKEPPKKAELETANIGGWDSEPPPPPVSKTESGVRGAVQGATLGFADEIAGATEAMWESAKGDPAKFGELYAKFRDESRDKFRQAKEANPATYMAGEVGGTVATALVPGVGAAGTVGKMAMTGAAVGGVSAAGASEADNLKDFAVDTGVGVVTGGLGGAVIGKGGQVIAKGAQRLGEKAGKTAARLAARAQGAERGTIKSMGADKVEAAGRKALDEKGFGMFSSTDEMIKRNEAMKSRGGQKMSEAYDAIDEAGASTFNPLETAAKVDEKIGGHWRSPINKGETNQLENTLESILMRGDKNISLKEAQILKEELGKVAKWKSGQVTDKEQMARDAYKVVSQQIDEAVANGSDVLERKGLTQVLKDGKSLYSSGKTSERLLDNKLAREQGNNFFGLTDTITGAGSLGYGSSTGDWEGAVGIMAAKKGVQKYGAQNAALLLDKVSKSLMKNPKMADVARTNPTKFKTIVAETAKRITPTREAPRAADTESEGEMTAEAKPLKGQDKWANDGMNKILKNSSITAEQLKKLSATPRGKQLLISASDLPPGSKAFKNLVSKIGAK